MVTEEKKSLLAERFEMVKYHFHLNNRELAQLAEVTPSAIFDIVHGKTENPKIGLLLNISQKLNINLVWLAKGDGEMIADSNNPKATTKAGNIETALLEFYIEQIREKDKIINHLMSNRGKLKGVSNKAGLYPVMPNFFGQSGTNSGTPVLLNQ